MKTLLRAGIISFLILNCVPAAFPSQISRKLDKLANDLSGIYRAKRPSVMAASFAIFNFSAEEKLARKKTGFAVSEILTQKFAKISAFKLVERMELERVLAEQKLQIAIGNTENAVEVGKILNAEIVLVGSVAKFGKNYQVNARIIDAETSEILAVGYAELPAREFEEEAKPYLQLVPDVQVIGLYGYYGLGVAATEAIGGVSFNGSAGAGSYTTSVSPQPPAQVANQPAGVGIRYFPRSWMMLDFSYAPRGALSLDSGVATLSAGSSDGTTTIVTGEMAVERRTASGAGGVEAQLIMPLELKSTDIGGGASWVKRFNPHLQGHLGAEARAYLLEAKVPNYTIESFYNASNNSVRRIGARVSENKVLIAPYIKLGVEWKPQSRIGIGIFGHVSPIKTEYQIEQRTMVIEGIYPPSVTNSTVADQNVPLYKVFVPQYLVTASLAFYF